MTTEPTDPELNFFSVDELPDDPLKMPPPYWRTSGAVFHIIETLEELTELMLQLVSVNDTIPGQLDEFRKLHQDDEDNSGFHEIIRPLWELEHRIKLRGERASLMCAISAEDAVNQLCVFNLHRDLAETIEKLSLPEKLLVASNVLGNKGVKSTDVYAGAKEITRWRNAFAHGHCTDRPVKSLRHNHLISPEEYPGVPSVVRETLQHLDSYLVLVNFLASISLNPYTCGTNVEDKRIEKLLSEIRQYIFTGDEHLYTLQRNIK
jgi:hypothetical protein